MMDKKGITWDVVGYLILGVAVLVMVSIAIYAANTGKFPAFIEQIRNMLK